MERPPAEPPPVDDNSMASNDSLPMECLSHLLDAQAPTRWLDNRCRTPPTTSHLDGRDSPVVQLHRASISDSADHHDVAELWSGHDWLDRDLHLSLNGRISPACVRDYPHLDCVGDGSSTLATSIRDVSEDTSAGDHSSDTLHDYPCVERAICDIRTIGIDGDSACFQLTDTPPPLPFATDSDDVSLADSGANTCMKRTEDGLEDCHDISPVTVSLALSSDDTNLTPFHCTRMGYLPMLRTDGKLHRQPFLVNAHATDMIMSPDAILSSCQDFAGWRQTGYKDSQPGSLQFFDDNDTPLLVLDLVKRNGLYYCPAVSTLSVTSHGISPDSLLAHRLSTSDDPPRRSRPSRKPVSRADLLESELWAARLGFCGESQLDALPGNVEGIPTQFQHHPFRFIDFKEQARIRKQAAGRKAQKLDGIGDRFYMDFGFMRASNESYTKRNKAKDRVVQSFDGYNCYLLIVDEVSRHTWAFLFRSKDPPVDTVIDFLKFYGNATGGVIRCDQGGELARSTAFRTKVQEQCKYVVEPTGADGASQNSGVERFNDTFAVMVRTLLYGSALPPTFWSACLLHAVYLYNRHVHSRTKRTPFEAFWGSKPNLRKLRLFGSRVCVKRTGKRDAKLDRHDFTGIFIGFTATDENIRYIDVASGIVKTSHHARFDESWYLQPTRPPAAQLLYDLGVVHENVDPISPPPKLTVALYPPVPELQKALPTLPLVTTVMPLPLRLTDPLPFNLAAAAAARVETTQNPHSDTAIMPGNEVADKYGISASDTWSVYFSPCPYADAFEEELNLNHFDKYKMPSAGFKFRVVNERLIMEHITKGSPAAKIPRWRSRLKGAWLTKVGDTSIASIADLQSALARYSTEGAQHVKLLFAQPEIRDGLTDKGIPQVNLDQLNPRRLLERLCSPPGSAPRQQTTTVIDGGVHNTVTQMMKLTRGKLMRDDDWCDWEASEATQLDQYDKQGMFGDPVHVDSSEAVFNLVWTYVIKELDKRKKARCTCDGSPRAGQARILDHTYANCVDQTSNRIFYAAAAAENLVIYGSDVCNAFGEAPPPKQGYYIRPDKAFHHWWVHHKKRPPIPQGHVIPVLRAMQGHPEAPRLWEKYADALLRDLGLTPTTHEPCLYSGIIAGERVLFKRQVDDFEAAVPNEKIANILFDMIDDRITYPLKRMGLVTLFNGIDVKQTRDWIKISVETYIDRIMVKHLSAWMTGVESFTRPTPLPSRRDFLRRFLSDLGDDDDVVQTALAKSNHFTYRSGVGELIYAYITCRPDLAYGVVRASQFNTCPAQIHYDGVKHMLKYLYRTKSDGIYFWRTTPNESLPYESPPTINSNAHDLLVDGRPSHEPMDLHGFFDADWAACPLTRRSMGGDCLRLAGGTIAYKARLQPTVAQSSTESEYMEASDGGRMLLFVRSILWDLGIPQCAASIAYEDNDACTAMANAQKPTARTRHMDVKYHVLAEWVERDLIHLERVHTSKNMADHFTKQLTPALFHRHMDYILGHVPPQYSHYYKQFYDRYRLRLTKPTIPSTVPDKLPAVDHDSRTPTAAAAARLVAVWNTVTEYYKSRL